jgi:hypothetical protein
LNKEEQRFANVIGNPAREEKLGREAKSCASSVRNNFREELRDGLIQEIGLEHWTTKMKDAFSRSTVSFTDDDMLKLTIRNALLVCETVLLVLWLTSFSQRRFAIEHRELLSISEESEEPATNGNGERPSKKRKRGGRPETDFWEEVDNWFFEKIEKDQWGTNLAGAKWQP